MNIDFEWLEDHVFHRHLDTGEHETLNKAMQVLEFKRGDILMTEGDQCDGLYLLYSGSAGVLHESNGEKIRVSEVKEGAQLGDMAIFDDAASSATITALSDCVAYKFPREALSQLMAYRQDMAKDIMLNTIRQMAGVIRGMNSSNAYSQQYIYGRRV
jgi:CRP-like cAMP-binding protein